MKIKELFLKPLDRSINGVIKADQNDDAIVYQELDEYVITNELEKHFRDFFDSYGTDLSDPSISNRVGVWISGFFGSGKSHFLKILSYILANKVTRDPEGNERCTVEFFDKQKICDSFIRANINKVVRDHADVILFNIDSKAKHNDEVNPILDVFLRVFNEQQGFSGDYPHIAHMERHLTQQGKYAEFKAIYKKVSKGELWTDQRVAYSFHQDNLEQAISETLNLSPTAAHKWFEDSEKNLNVTVENFCRWIKEYLDSKENPKHRIVFLVDEVGQFIGSDTKLMLTLQTITENLGTICKGRAWIIVTSQSDIDAVLGELSASKANDFSKIAGRFKTRLSLSSSNTDEVIQKRLLRKTPKAVAQLKSVFGKTGDILKNQITFEQSGPTLKNFDGSDSFVNNYPFVPYHFQLVQKVFEEIRKVGATGAHLAYGERSMLEAFQLAAQSIAGEEIGVLVPMHQFYASIEGFLDPAVKRTIAQAEENVILDSFDVQMLRTLFMIRYVDLIKGTQSNLVTLSIEKIDDDKLALRKRIEESLQRLEKESLVIRNGDEFLFLTNEERDITQKIKTTDIASSEENKELSDLIFKDLLRDNNKYRHKLNKKDYSIGRYLDGHSLDGRDESDLKVEVVSPLDVDYSQYSEGMCINKSTEGQILIKLDDDKQFFNELKTWLKTNKYIRLNSGNTPPDITRILDDRGRENQERKKRLRTRMEDMLLKAEAYARGQRLLDLSSTHVSHKFDEAYRSLLENTYTKLDYIKVYQDDPWRELNAVLTTDDIAQMGFSLEGAAEVNPKALSDVKERISLKSTNNERIRLADIVEHYSKRPYGWPDTEVLLIVARLAVAGHISFQFEGATLPMKEAFEPFKNTRRRREIIIIKKRHTDEAALKQAQNLTKDFFDSMGPATEKELFEFYNQRFNTWLSNLELYKNKTDGRDFPGKKKIAQSILVLNRLLNNNDSFDFFKQVVDKKDDYLALEEDYQDIHGFFSKQLTLWNELQTALNNFDKNRPTLEKDADTSAALAELRSIAADQAPYAKLNQVKPLISQVNAVNKQLLTEKRTAAQASVNDKIEQLKEEIKKRGIATAELNNQLLKPLQDIKKDMEEKTSIADIHMLQTETTEEQFDNSIHALDKAVHAEIERRAKAEQAAKKNGKNPTNTNTVQSKVEKPPERLIAPPKPVVEVDVSSVYNKTCKGVYLETEESVEQFIAALKAELQSIVRNEKRARIR